MDDKGAAERSDLVGTITKRSGPLKSRLLKTIGAATREEAGAALDRIWPLGVFDVRRVPRSGMVMVTACDCFDTPFHLGEALVSEAEVTLAGHRGYGMVCGDAPEQALLLAAVEAAEFAGHHTALESIVDFIERLEARDAARSSDTEKLVAATQVRFASMKKERVDFGALGETELEPKHE